MANGWNAPWDNPTKQANTSNKKSQKVATEKKVEEPKKDTEAGKTPVTPAATTDTPVNATGNQLYNHFNTARDYINSSSEADFDDEVDGDESNDYLDKTIAQYEAALAEQKAAIQAAVDQSVNSLNSQKTTTAQDYADAYRQLYLNNMKGQKNIGQQMAAQGITGGASESTLLGMNTNYEDNLRQGKVAEQNALSELDQAIINAQLSGSIEAANANATNAQNTANAYLTAWQQQLAADQAAQQLAASQKSEDRQYSYQMAMALLQGGSMPSDELLASAGISKADAQTIVAQYIAAKAASGNGGTPEKLGDDWTKYVSEYGQYDSANEKSDALATRTAVLTTARSDKKKAKREALLNYQDDVISYATYRSIINAIDNLK